MRYVLRRAAGIKRKPWGTFRPKTGPVPMEVRAVEDVTGGPQKMIEELQKTGLKLFKPPYKGSIGMNGMKAFVPAINKLTFLYNPVSRRSDFLMLYIQQVLPAFARENPHIEVCCTSSDTREPMVIALYHNGKIKQMPTARRNLEDIVRGVEELADQRGNEAKEFKHPVISHNPSPAPVWDPFHSDLMFKP